jgi:hypothetical protein
MAKFTLNFVGYDSPELLETTFSHPLLDGQRRCIRGKSSGAFEGYCTFQWTKAVQGLSRLVIGAVLEDQLGKRASTPHLIGFGLSHAASFDYAIDKQTTWLFDMFGWDKNGLSLARRLFNRTNPGRKRAGPVAISLNTKFFNASDIEIYLDGAKITDAVTLIGLLRRIKGLDMSQREDVAQSGLKLVA